MNFYVFLGGFFATVLTAAVAFLSRAFLNWLELSSQNLTNKEIQEMITGFVRAAEQQLSEKDPGGVKRKEYVLKMLTEAGIDLDAAIDALIESAVWEVNAANRKEGRSDA